MGGSSFSSQRVTSERTRVVKLPFLLSFTPMAARSVMLAWLLAVLGASSSLTLGPSVPLGSCFVSGRFFKTVPNTPSRFCSSLMKEAGRQRHSHRAFLSLISHQDRAVSHRLLSHTYCASVSPSPHSLSFALSSVRNRGTSCPSSLSLLPSFSVALPSRTISLFSKRDRATRSTGPVDASAQTKLRPAKDALQRILWDPNLDPADFTVGFVDRFSESFSEVRCDAPNSSIKGPDRLFVLALPEHRIAYIKYRRRVVWHRADRIDRLFASGVAGPDGSRQRIQEVVALYGAWLAEERALARAARQLAREEEEARAAANFKSEAGAMWAGGGVGKAEEEGAETEAGAEVEVEVESNGRADSEEGGGEPEEEGV